MLMGLSAETVKINQYYCFVKNVLPPLPAEKRVLGEMFSHPDKQIMNIRHGVNFPAFPEIKKKVFFRFILNYFNIADQEGLFLGF